MTNSVKVSASDDDRTTGISANGPLQLFGVMTTEAYKYVALFLEILTQQRTDFLEKGREGKRGGVVNFLTHC